MAVDATEHDGADATVALYEATHGDQRTGLKNVYVLGSLCSGELVALSVQQTRAINLVHALLRSGRIKPGARMAVLGGGAAGLTAAAYAISQGVRVVTFENRGALWNLRGCRTRWLHPNLFPKWPHEGWDVTATTLPVMNWSADYACNVGDLLWSKYNSIQLGSRMDSSVLIVREVHFHAVSRGMWQAQYALYGGDGTPKTQEPFEVLIIAVGFGSEAPRRDAATSVYWLEDSIEREDPHRPAMRYLVSGTGDGGLTDLLRIRLKNFRHHHLRDILTTLTKEELRDSIHEAETRRNPDGKLLNDRQLSDAYLEIARRTVEQNEDVNQLLSKELRPNTSVLLTNRGEVPFPRGGAWRVSRFLGALLLAHDEGQTRYVPGGGRIRTIVPPNDLAPTQFFFRHNGADHKVDAIVIRHGTVPVIDSVLGGLGLEAEDRAMVSAKWVQKTTSVRGTWDRPSAENLDHRWRNRNCNVRPIIGGRTPIGLLSRLVTLVGPSRSAFTPSDATTGDLVRTDLVTDALALGLASDSDRWDIPPSPDGWALRGEVEVAKLLDAIRRIDRSLDCLVSQDNCDRIRPCSKCNDRSRDSRTLELELHWVLPRYEWIDAPSDLLEHTVVATWWGGYRLKYLDLLGVTVPDWGRTLLRMVRTASKMRRFYVVDCEFREVRYRFAIAAARSSRTLRLGRELGAKTLVFDGGYVSTD